jgi:predicted metalloprotease with PDZ domain
MGRLRSTAAAWMAFGSIVTASCAARPGAPGAAPNAAAARRGARWDYDVALVQAGDALRVVATFPEGSGTELVVEPRAAAFVRHAEVESAGGWTPAAQKGEAWDVEACAAGCRLRYEVALREAAEAIADVDIAAAFGATVESPPSAWLLHPAAAGDARFRLHVTTPPGTDFVTGVFPNGGLAPREYEADAGYLGVAPYSAFGALRVVRPDVLAGADIEVAVSADFPRERDEAIARWVARSARAVAGYFGCFPVPRVAVIVVPTSGAEIGRGHALGDGGAGIVVQLGRDVPDDALERDIVLPHEMVHLGFPSVSRRHHWMEEGVAVYVQPIARARAGQESPEDAWRELALGLPRGEPEAKDRGLDDAPTWARTYWGGALFCLLADIEIRERTRNRRSLEDALRGIVRGGGSIAVEWDLERVLGEGDRAVGAPVLEELYAKMGERPMKVDLPAVYRKLGIVVDGDRVTFDDAAPQAAMRRAITARGEVDGDEGARACPTTAAKPR